MKKKPLILLIFLLSLCLIPPTSAVYGDASSESITSFSETLPDDVLYYPDFDLEANVSTTTEYIDNMESVTYWDAGGKDWDTWESADGNLHARHDSVGANEYPLRHMDWDDNDDPDPRPEVTEYDDTTYSWYLRFKVDYNDTADYFRIGFYDTPWGGTLEWFNLLTYSKNVWHYVVYDPIITMTDLDRIDVNAQLDNNEYAELWLDWIAVIPTANNLDPSFNYDNTSYREGFNDVSDWSVVAGLSPTTDGDVLTLSHNGDSDWDSIESVIPSLSSESYYIEFRAKWNQSGTALIVYISVNEQDDWSGATSAPFGYLYFGTAWITYRELVSQSIENIRIGYHADSAVGLLIDYMRIAPANESGGWQHDGSTTEGVVTGAGSGGTMTTDGDYISLIADGDGSSFDFFIDTTSTQAKLDPDYYPFLEMQFHSGDVGTDIRVQYYTTGYGDVQAWTTITQIMRWNLRAVTGDDVLKIRIMLLASDTIRLALCKSYSIANFSLTQSAGTDPSTVLYVENNALIWSLATSVYITLAHDPALSTDTSIYTTVTANITKADSSAVVGFNWEETISGARWRLVDEKTAVMQSGTLTDMRTSIDVSGTWTLSAIKFIDTRDWQEIGEVEFVIPVGWDPTFIFGYDAFFIFLGLIMIPVSTMYLVRGGREEMSADKLFYGLIIFAVGFGLLVGGIMP